MYDIDAETALLDAIATEVDNGKLADTSAHRAYALRREAAARRRPTRRRGPPRRIAGPTGSHGRGIDSAEPAAIAASSVVRPRQAEGTEAGPISFSGRLGWRS
jgi:hypothetical protein